MTYVQIQSTFVVRIVLTFTTFVRIFNKPVPTNLYHTYYTHLLVLCVQLLIHENDINYSVKSNYLLER